MRCECELEGLRKLCWVHDYHDLWWMCHAQGGLFELLPLVVDPMVVEGCA